MKPRVLLLFPSTRSLGNLRPPLGVLVAAAPLAERGVELVFVDQRVEPDFKDIINRELDKGLVCVGISTMGNDQLINCIDMCRYIRERSTVPIVMGGIHPSLDPENTINSSYADILVLGEGDESFAEVVDCLISGGDLKDIRGIAYKGPDGEIVFTSQRWAVDMDKVSRPLFNLVDMSKYASDHTWFNFSRDRVLPFETSRGCLYKCGYCVMSVEKYKWRGMSAEKVADDIEFLVKTYGVRSFSFVDNNFFVDKERAAKICELFIKRKLDIEWYAPIRADFCCRVGLDYFKQVEQAGCKSLFVGLESGSDRILEIMKKRETAAHILEANRILSKTNILTHYGAILGYPYETLQDVQETYKVAMQLVKENPNARMAFNKLIVNPATPVFSECVKRGFKAPDSIEEWCIKIDNSWNDSDPWIDPEIRRWILKHKYFTEKVITYKNMGLFMGNEIFGFFSRMINKKVGKSNYGDIDRRLFSALMPAYNMVKNIRKTLQRTPG